MNWSPALLFEIMQVHNRLLTFHKSSYFTFVVIVLTNRRLSGLPYLLVQDGGAHNPVALCDMKQSPRVSNDSAVST